MKKNHDQKPTLALAALVVALVQEAPEDATVKAVRRLQDENPEWGRFAEEFIVGVADIALETLAKGDARWQ